MKSFQYYNKTNKVSGMFLFIILMLFGGQNILAETPVAYQAMPIIGATSTAPLVMLVLGRDHKLYYEAYNDASDLNEDGVLDVGYNPAIEYYGYFDSYKVYTYSSANQRFEPLRETDTKKVSPGATNEWSGDFLNYVTMSRMDAIRKVLFGGYRSTDTATETVLERAYVPQDAHTWGKEYESVARDGYDIRDYTPLDLPGSGLRHLIASTSLADPSDSSYRPLLRVLPNNTHRIWEWVSKERPVADSSLVSAGGAYNQHPADHAGFGVMMNLFANASHFQGSSPATQINGSGNPHGASDDYMTIFTGNITVSSGGSYQFAVDGDDAVEFILDGVVVAGWYGGHGNCGCTTHSGTIALTAGSHAIEFRHEEDGGGDNYYLRWNGPDSGGSWQMVPAAKFSGLMQTNYNLIISGSTITDYVVRVQVGVNTLQEKNCKLYTNETTGAFVYKPIGLLQRYGEPERMYFGLMTGSYTKNTSGGVLRKNIGDIKDEINPNTGQFTSVNGIIQTINKFRIVDFSYTGYSYNNNCGWVATRAINEGECRMWGNPIGEMMYETLRYFAGESSATPAFTYDSSSSNDDNRLGLPKPSWQNPYATYPECSKPFMLVLSDINPSYDSDQLPGSYFGSFSGDDLGGLDAKGLADFIGGAEGESGAYYIGEEGATQDYACTAKTLTSGLGKIRGLCPEEPTKQGSYYSAAVAYFGHTNDISDVAGEQLVNTFAVGLASPLPRIEIPVAGKTITIVPFAKSVGGYGISAAQGYFQPTNTIVDFYVATISPTYGKFRINYEDVEQGADHDMDAITSYEYQVVDASGADVTDPALGVGVKVKLTSEYAAGSIIQHSGYIISGTTQDGTYLEVRDMDTASASDPDYFLDTPAGQPPGGIWNDGAALPLFSVWRTFSPSFAGAPSAKLLKNPLWYTGKWGGFEDQDNDDKPNLATEWDANNDGTPDNYFYVTNPLRLEEQLNESFAAIAAKTAAGTSASVIATTNEGDGTIIQAYFRPVTATETTEIKWMGYLRSLWVDTKGYMREDTNGNRKLDTTEDRVIVFINDNGETKVRRYEVSVANPYPNIKTDGYFTVGMEGITPLWEAGKTLWNTDPIHRNILTTATGSEGDPIAFEESNLNSIKYLLGVSDADITRFQYANIGLLGSSLDNRARALINYIRGTDSPSLRTRTIDGKIWKLGDIVYSSPVSVSKPVESFHLIYSDKSYGDYYDAQKNRPTVVYVGGNDGMLHAFASWQYNSVSNTFTDNGMRMGAQGGTIGDELWAYIPRAVLPHLKWLSDPDYSHSYFVDLTPRVFDAKIAGSSKNQWGTFLLLGLNMGGKDIPVDTNGDGTAETLKPTYTLLDVTDPTHPKVMWERSYEGLGMSRSTPGIMKIGGDVFDPYGEMVIGGGGTERWLAAFGSGPQGNLAYQGISDQPGRIYVIDLKTGDPLQGTDATGTHDYLFTTSNNSVINSPVAYDYGLRYEVETVYFGESIIVNPTNPSSGWTGKVWSFDTFLNWSGQDPDTHKIDPYFWDVTDDQTKWHLHLLLTQFQPDPVVPTTLDVGPISAPISLSEDDYGNAWVYFGTGRFISEKDKTDTSRQHLFGLKDPLLSKSHSYTSAAYATGDPQIILKSNLLNSSIYRVKSDRTVEKFGSGAWGAFGSWEDLLHLVRQENTLDADGNEVIDPIWTDGWFRAMDISTDTPPGPSERCASKCSVLGGALFAPTFIPSADMCAIGGGMSYLYGLYYETGTNFYKPVVGDSEEIIKTDIGGGSPSPTAPIHIGEDATAEITTGSGAIISLKVKPPIPYKSRIVNWLE